MSFARFSQYVKTMAAGGVCVHLFINELVFGIILGRPDLVAHPFPVALPIGLIGAAYGWRLIYKSPLPPVYRDEASECPCCKQKIIKRVRVDDLTNA